MKSVVIMIDTLRYDFMGFNGNPWVRTPNLDRLAERSTVFTNAYLGSYPCMPARRDLFTGRFEFPWRGWGPLEHDEHDIASLVTGSGRTSMLVTDHYHLWERGAGNYHFGFSGVEFVRGQELDTWRTQPLDAPELPAPPEKLAQHCGSGAYLRYLRNIADFEVERDYFAPTVFQASIDWLEKNHSHDDYLLMIDCFDPHEPFDPPQPFDRLYDPEYTGDKVTWPNYGQCDLNPEELEHVRALYAGELTLVDKWLGRLLEKVEELGSFEDTAIVVTTDHGHMFGEHGLMGKPWSGLADSNLYQELVHVPLLVYHPDQSAAGRRVDHLVQPVDLFPTTLEVLGVPVPDDIHGTSLLPLVRGDAPPVRDVAAYGRFGEAVNVTDGRWTLFLWPPGERNEPLYWHSALPPQFGTHGQKALGPPRDGRYPVGVARGDQHSALYDLEADPRQERNVIDEAPEVADRLRAGLRQWLEEIDAPPEVGARIGLR